MSPPPAKDPPDVARRARGFQRAGRLVAPKLAAAARKRGFLETRLLTEWEAIVGPEIANATRPVKMTRPRTAAGASARGGTLTVQADGARAPEVQMMLPTLKARVNAALGWPAVAQVRLVQAWGFAEEAAAFAGAPQPPAPPPDPARLAPLAGAVSSIGDAGLRAALETLARNVVSRR
jgi:hypothetical protein